MSFANTWLFCLWLAAAPVLADWYPVTVRADGELRQYRPLERARQPWRICALLPHGMDRYWWGVAWGLDGEAKRQGVGLGIYEAGGYAHTGGQARQMQECREMQADAYLIAATHASELCPQIEQLLTEGRPVIDLVNGLECAGLTAHSRVNYSDMVGEVLAYVEGRREAGPYSIGWLPGPQGAAWVRDAEHGLQRYLRGRSVQLVHGGYAPVDRSSQARLTRRLISQRSQLDYLLGNAEAAGFAAELVHASVERRAPQVLAIYATERIVEQIRDGFILAAPCDSPVLQARIAIDLAVRALEGRPHPREVGPLIEMLDQRALRSFDISRLMPPEGHWMIRRDMPVSE
jgi:protein TorT